MGTHPIFESDFDCLTELKMGLAPATVVKTLTSRLFSVFTNILRRQLVEADSVVNRQLFDFRGRVLASHKSWTKKRINIKLYWIKKLELKMAFPQSELLDPKTEKEIIEMAADLGQKWSTQSTSPSLLSRCSLFTPITRRKSTEKKSAKNWQAGRPFQR